MTKYIIILIICGNMEAIIRKHKLQHTLKTEKYNQWVAELEIKIVSTSIDIFFEAPEKIQKLNNWVYACYISSNIFYLVFHTKLRWLDSIEEQIPLLYAHYIFMRLINLNPFYILTCVQEYTSAIENVTSRTLCILVRLSKWPTNKNHCYGLHSHYW